MTMMHTDETNDKGAPDQARPQVWSYDRTAGWLRIDDPLQPGDGGGFDDWLLDHGYVKQLDYRGGVSALSLELYADDEERFIVVPGNCCFHWRVHVEGFPNLIAVLSEVLPAVRGVAELEAVEERDERERQRKRRGPTVYNPRRKCMEFARAGN
jgi:hypothetical protein